MMFSLFKRTLWLVRDDPEGSWHCDCEMGVVDASWHSRETHPVGGSGWLFCCANCSRAFMYARGELIRGTLEKLAKRQTPRVQKVISPGGGVVVRTLLATPDDWLKLCRPLAAQVRQHERYVFFDGHILPAVHGPVKFDGLFRSHDLPDLPHLSESLMEKTLVNPEYWDV